jgi:hypothetical protein
MTEFVENEEIPDAIPDHVCDHVKAVRSDGVEGYACSICGDFWVKPVDVEKSLKVGSQSA